MDRLSLWYILSREIKNHKGGVELSKKYYGLSNDYLFKKVFGRKEYCRQLLNDIFSKRVGLITYLNKEFKKENKELSYGICDVL